MQQNRRHLSPGHLREREGGAGKGQRDPGAPPPEQRGEGQEARSVQRLSGEAALRERRGRRPSSAEWTQSGMVFKFQHTGYKGHFNYDFCDNLLKDTLC